MFHAPTLEAASLTRNPSFFMLFCCFKVPSMVWILVWPISKVRSLKNRRFNFFNDDSAYWIPACMGICRCSIRLTILNVKTNSDLSRSYSATVTFNIGRAVDINVGTMIHYTINSGRSATLYVIKSEVPPLTAVCASCNTRVPHVNNTEVCIVPLFIEIAFLKRRYISGFIIRVCKVS